MTIQDKTKLTKGFRNKTPSLYQSRRLIDFLNVDTKNIQEIKDFCTKHTIVPYGNIKDMLKTFSKEQKLLADVVTKAIKSKLTPDDLAIINRRLKGIHPAVRLMESKDVIKVNNVLPRLEGNLIQLNRQYFIKTSVHANSFASLWDDLVSYMISEQPLKMCGNCGQFFSPSQRTGNKQRFCNNYCRDNYHKTQKYHENKAK